MDSEGLNEGQRLVGLAIRGSVSWKDRWLPKRGILTVIGNDKPSGVAMKASG